MSAIRRLRLRLRAWLLCRRDPDAHPVAALIAAGRWSALDAMLVDMDAFPVTPPVRSPMTPGVGKWE